MLGNLSSSLSDVAVKLLEGGISAFQYMFIRQLLSVLFVLPLWLKLAPAQRAIGMATERKTGTFESTGHPNRLFRCPGEKTTGTATCYCYPVLDRRVLPACCRRAGCQLLAPHHRCGTRSDCCQCFIYSGLSWLQCCSLPPRRNWPPGAD